MREKARTIIFNCDFCGKEKEVYERIYNLSDSHFCCFKCKSESLRKPRKTVECEACGKPKEIREKEYEQSKDKKFFCNKKCQMAWYAKDPKNNPNYRGGQFRLCDFCGKVEIYVKNSKLNQRNFCSKECSDKFFVGKNAPAWKGGKIERICKQCGESFLVTPAEAKRNKAIFCSQNCVGIFKRKGKVFNCPICNEEVYKPNSQIFENKNVFCSKECVRIFISGENNINWAGGDEFCLYDDYSHRLEPIEETRRLPQDKRILQTKCTYCNSWITPKKDEVGRRLAYIEGRWKVNQGEPRFYCPGEGCKQNCSIFNRKVYPKGFQPATSREVQAELRKLCFERDNWTCQKCGATDNLHCHHIDPVVNNPVESADLDNVICYCADCHEEAHNQEGCFKNQLKCN